MIVFYLSFVDPDKPEGQRWLGACVVEVPALGDERQNLRAAIQVAHICLCNPGGEIMSLSWENAAEVEAIIPREKWFKLLTAADMPDLVGLAGKPPTCRTWSGWPASRLSADGSMSSKRRIRRKQCTGKIRHRSLGGAIAAAKSLRRAKGEIVSAYSCRFCKGYHVGHWGGPR
jgi:hypothetical protein